MTYSVALAMLQRDGCWLLQLRDDIDTIIYPGHWGLFGGHVEAGEAPEQAVLRELEEEIGWRPETALPLWFSHDNGSRIAHVFRGELTDPIERLHLQEGQDLKLTSMEELSSGHVWSDHRGETRPIAPGLRVVIDRLLAEADG